MKFSYTGLSDKRLALAVVAAGFTAIVTQTILLREFLSVFSGNELVIGIVLAAWMILTGGGSLLGRLSSKSKDKIRTILIVLFVESLLPLVTVFSLEYLRNFIFPVGTMLSVFESFYTSFIVLMPFCLLSGYLFTVFSAIVSEQSNSNRISEVYTLEAIGSVLGGFLFSLLFVFLFSTFQILFLLMVLDLGVCLYLSVEFSFRSLQIAVIATTSVVLLVNSQVDFDGIAKRSLFPGQELLFHKDTPYGNLVVTSNAHQKNFYENGSLLFVTGDRVSNEDVVHYAMIQHPHPKNVLLIGGGISGTTGEILKHGVEHVDYVELNSAIIDIGERLSSSLADPRIFPISQDGRRYLRKCQRTYDVAIVNVPDPSTAQINRYYTVEFFGELKRSLAQDAVVSLSLLESVDYMGVEARHLTSVICRTLNSQFKHVLILPGLRNHLLASDEDLTTDVAKTIAQRSIPTIFVNENYVDDQLLGKRSSEIMTSLDATAQPNYDFTPVAYFAQLQYWLSYFGLKPWLPAALIGILLLVVLLRLNPVSLGMFTGGFAASSVEIIILIAFQVIYGYVYQATGIIIAIFMAGLAAGSFIGRKWTGPVDYNIFGFIQVGLVIYSLLLPVALHVVKSSPDSDALVYFAFTILTILVSLMVGVEFSFATSMLKTDISSVASSLYAVDLIGSAFGALVISIYVVPLLGITFASFVVAALCAFSCLASFRAGRRTVVLSNAGANNV